jgi:hypothetical protein
MLSISLFACAALISIAKRKAEKKTVIPSIEYSHPWTTTDFRKNAHELVDFMCEYYETLENKPILSTVNPGYLSKILPTEAQHPLKVGNKSLLMSKQRLCPE